MNEGAARTPTVPSVKNPSTHEWGVCQKVLFAVSACALLLGVTNVSSDQQLSTSI